MLPVGFPRDFIGQLAHCLELCFENRRELRKAKKTAKVVRRTTGTTAAAPPPPPQEQPPPLRTGLPPGASAEGGAGALPPQVVDHRKFGGVALPGFDRPSAAPAPAQHNTSGLQPAAQPHGAFAGGADGTAAAAPPAAAAAAAEGGVGQISPASARALRDQVRPSCSPTLPGLRCRFALSCAAGRAALQPLIAAVWPGAVRFRPKETESRGRQCSRLVRRSAAWRGSCRPWTFDQPRRTGAKRRVLHFGEAACRAA